ncbi:MAG: alcohol dehydrogenase catalytic domain-containing protein [Ilumatobacteraceae bacterium]
MKHAVWTTDGLSVEDVEPPALPDGFVRLQVEACGICGSDLHFWTGHQHPALATVPGHEFVGTILDAPAGVADGRYAASPIVRCGTCEHCLAGEWNLCRRGGELIGMGRNGGLAEWVDVPLVNLVPLGDVGPEVGMLAEPMAVAVRGVGLAGLAADETVLVLGAGTIGLLAALIAQRTSDKVVVSARYPHQVAAAEALGLTTIAEADVIGWGKQQRPSAVIETVGGTANTINDAIKVAKRGGRVIVLGTFAQPSVDLFSAQLKEVSITPSFAYGTRDGVDDFAEAAAVLAEHRDTLPTLITHRFALDDVTTGFETALDKSSGAVKVAVVNG